MEQCILVYPHHNYAIQIQIRVSCFFQLRALCFKWSSSKGAGNTEEIQLSRFICTQTMRLQVCHVDARLNALPRAPEAFLSCNTQPLN